MSPVSIFGSNDVDEKIGLEVCPPGYFSCKHPQKCGMKKMVSPSLCAYKLAPTILSSCPNSSQVSIDTLGLRGNDRFNSMQLFHNMK